MAKSTSKKTSSAKTNTAFSKKSNGHLKPAKNNASKLKPTKDADIDVMELEPSDGLIKLFTDCLKDIYWAENHLIKALPKMAKATSVEKLEKAILDHLDQTKTHAERLKQVFELLRREPKAKKCDAMEGLTKEGEAAIENTDTASPARNLAIIMGSQKVEHYEIASYLGIIKLADNLGYTEISEILTDTLNEELESDALLADIAANDISYGEEA
ncbi:MAG TPA: ferritin-like domain-containing protein [Chitinophagaceae bacterium]|nr:ferritin-like domain-containing protein [Chitinophagaceae bacterium]